ncbi:hypothetical protein WAI453_000939 [Rhynchosporium graminicola]
MSASANTELMIILKRKWKKLLRRRHALEAPTLRSEKTQGLTINHSLNLRALSDELAVRLFKVNPVTVIETENNTRRPTTLLIHFPFVVWFYIISKGLR